MWRDHLEKFSPAWFVAVHASIPLIMLMRKSALLPKYAIAATISCAILGQYLGSRYERARVAETGGVTVGALQVSLPTLQSSPPLFFIRSSLLDVSIPVP